ncbi:putative methionine transporter, NhaC family [Paucidesulfovibrio gracilis DSM 16080]|uniref:Putative methionine transporter, NhaC family n=1 Tax=Paucidesulfovibrio gracilis DSM 16080 TaxID=1121449 RepID=A0A1T4XXN6_9BACT|nr:Na+/H+ antiporter NhaC family protein [Paucidesulfovibrio gracilis]SKA93805.1 putative methionine transporter, NhaC family [Paucidesulfovibrio gracilis DSM 16080]
MNQQSIPPRGSALLPLLLFLALFIGTGTVLTIQGKSMAFYQLSAAVAILPAIALALLMGKEKLDKKISIFLHGVGDINIVTMCVIYLLAGGFASVAKAIGGVDATVNLGLAFIPAELVLPGLFTIAAFVATSMGTSMGTIAAIAPIAAGVGHQTDISIAMLMGTVVGGAMFGDNLSMISDTTIAATRTQNCAMSDKFKMNFRIVTPAALGTLLLLGFLGTSGTVTNIGDWEFIRVVPYLVILGLAVAGVNVFVVLATGIVLAGGVGLTVIPDYSLLQFAQDIYSGFASMHEILVLSMLVGGLGELIRFNGGLQWLLERVNSLARRAGRGNTRRSGEFGIASLVALADACTANNTVAIILTGRLAKEIAADTGVDPRRSASLLDIFSCIVQGMTPYAAQVLLAGSIAGISPVAVVANNWYCMVLAVISIGAITTGLPKIKKQAAESLA